MGKYYNFNFFAILFRKEVWNAYLTLEIVKQDKCHKDNGSTLLCPAVYYVKQNTVSTLAFNILLFKFSLSTCCSRIMLLHSLYFFLQISTSVHWLVHECVQKGNGCFSYSLTEDERQKLANLGWKKGNYS